MLQELRPKSIHNAVLRLQLSNYITNMIENYINIS